MESKQIYSGESSSTTDANQAASVAENPLRGSAATANNEPSDNGTASNDGYRPVRDIAHVEDAPADVDKPIEATSFPPLSNDAPASPEAAENGPPSDGDEGGLAPDRAFPRSSSPASASQRYKVSFYQKRGEDGICHLHKFWLYETGSRFYVVGGDVMERKFRLLKIDRTSENGRLSVSEDDIVYGKKEMNQLLHTMSEASKASGGMKLVYTFWGLLGFVRFTGAYYMLLITKRSSVAVIGGHYVYQIDGTELVSLTSPPTRSKVERDPEEARFIGILNNLDLTRSFYFSYSYNITRTLQQNITRERRASDKDSHDNAAFDFNPMFVWNHYLLKPVSTVLKTTYDWCLPIIHGFIDQASTRIMSLCI